MTARHGRTDHGKKNLDKSYRKRASCRLTHCKHRMTHASCMFVDDQVLKLKCRKTESCGTEGEKKKEARDRGERREKNTVNKQVNFKANLRTHPHK